MVDFEAIELRAGEQNEVLQAKRLEDEQRAEERRIAGAALDARRERRKACETTAAGIMDRMRGMIDDLAPIDTAQVSYYERYSDAGRAQQAALDQPISIVVNLGPFSDPAKVAEYKGDGNAYARITAGGRVYDPHAFHGPKMVAGRPATYDSLHRPPEYRDKGTPATLVDEVTVSTFTRSAANPDKAIPLPVTETYSRSAILGRNWYGQNEGPAHMPRVNYESEEFVTEAEARVATAERDATDTLALLYDRARNPALNPDLAPLLAAREAARVADAA